jgi:uncharacterized RDD family membrane protein YckC
VNAEERGTSLLGHYAGPVTRLLAYVVDSFVSTTLFSVGVTAMLWVVDLLTNRHVDVEVGPWWLVPLGTFNFFYYWYCWSVSGKTPGKALLGLRVVRADGAPLGPLAAAIRVLTFPLSFAIAGLGFLGIVFGREHRALHDLLAGSAVVYDFDARAARLRFLARRHDDERVPR